MADLWLSRMRRISDDWAFSPRKDIYIFIPLPLTMVQSGWRVCNNQKIGGKNYEIYEMPYIRLGTATALITYNDCDHLLYASIPLNNQSWKNERLKGPNFLFLNH